MKFISFLLIVGALSAQPTRVTVRAVTTRALVAYKSPDSSTCQVVVTGPDGTAPATSETLFPGSSADGGTAPGYREFIAGKHETVQVGTDGRRYSMALRAAAPHSVTVTCTGGAVTATFTTAPVSSTVPCVVPFDTTAWGNYNWPEFDFTLSGRMKPVIDPCSGAPIYRVGDPAYYAFASGSFASPSGQYVLGTSWTSPANAGTNGASLANTSGTNKLFIPIDSTAVNQSGGLYDLNTLNGQLVDIAALVTGRGDDATLVNRQVDLCLGDSGGTCQGITQRITLVNSATTPTASTVPITFPVPPFSTWGTVLTRDQMTSAGTVNVSGTAVTRASSTTNLSAGIFRYEWVGKRIYIATSSCAQNLCLVTGVTNGDQLTISESQATLTGVAYKFAGLGWILQKVSGTGTIYVSIGTQYAKQYTMQTNGTDSCGEPFVITKNRDGSDAGRNITVRLCHFSRPGNGGKPGIYMVGVSEYDFRFLSMGRPPASIAGHATQDLPSGTITDGFGTSGNVWSPTDGRAWSAGVVLNGGALGLFALTYTGDGTEGALWNADAVGTVAYVSDGITWNNTTKPSLGQGLRDKILASVSGYDESRYGSLNSGLRYDSNAGNYAIFHKFIDGDQEYPAWIFTFNATTGNLANYFFTLTGSSNLDRAGSLHAIKPAGDKVFVSNNGLRNFGGAAYGGPFVAAVTHVQQSDLSWSTTTDVTWPTATAQNRLCPVDLAPQWIAAGAVGDRCLTVRVSTDLCSSNSSVNERTWSPCPGDAAKSIPLLPVAEGAGMHVNSEGGDNENFLVVRRVNDTGTAINLTLLRNTGSAYCCIAWDGADTRSCAQSSGQLTHPGPWSVRLRPAVSCNTISQLYDPATLAMTLNNPLLNNHSGYSPTNSGKHSMVAAGNGFYLSAYDRLNALAGGAATAQQLYNTSFSGLAVAQQDAQSYSSPTPGGADSNRLAVDWRIATNAAGYENKNNQLGSLYTLTNITGDIWRMSAVSGTTDPHRAPIAVWVGRNHLRDASNGTTGVDQSLAAWYFCYAFRNGECRITSTAGQLFLNVPGGLESTSTICADSQITWRVPCAFSSPGGFGQVLQFAFNTDDPTGGRQRRLGMALNTWGSQYAYSAGRPLAGTNMIAATTYHHRGVFTLPIAYDPGPWAEDGSSRNTFVGVPVTVPNNSIVEFGYDEYSGYCTTRAEACKVSAAAGAYSELTPFKFTHESLTATTGTTTVMVPFLPGRIGNYRRVVAGVAGPWNRVVVQ